MAFAELAGHEFALNEYAIDSESGSAFSIEGAAIASFYGSSVKPIRFSGIGASSVQANVSSIKPRNVGIAASSTMRISMSTIRNSRFAIEPQTKSLFYLGKIYTLVFDSYGSSEARWVVVTADAFRINGKAAAVFVGSKAQAKTVKFSANAKAEIAIEYSKIQYAGFSSNGEAFTEMVGSKGSVVYTNFQGKGEAHVLYVGSFAQVSVGQFRGNASSRSLMYLSQIQDMSYKLKGCSDASFILGSKARNWIFPAYDRVERPEEIRKVEWR